MGPWLACGVRGSHTDGTESTRGSLPLGGELAASLAATNGFTHGRTADPGGGGCGNGAHAMSGSVPGGRPGPAARAAAARVRPRAATIGVSQKATMNVRRLGAAAAGAPRPAITPCSSAPSKTASRPARGVHSQPRASASDAAREVIRTAVTEVEGVLPTPAPQVLLVELGDSSVNFEVRYWTAPDIASVMAAQDRVLSAAKRAIETAGMTIPWPIRTLVLDDAVRVRAEGALRGNGADAAGAAGDADGRAGAADARPGATDG